MKKISYNQCLKEMFALGRFGIKLELSTIQGILSRLGLVRPTFKAVHLAGTNGKGSTAAYCADLLRQSGFKTGLYTSPHLIKFNERFSINGKDVSDQDIVEAYLAVKKADTGERQATFFEIATAIGLYLFHREKVDWAVMETGMGGRLDATNILEPQVTIITNISMEHTDYLGTTIEAITREKGGIIKENTPVITAIRQNAARDIIRSIAREKAAPLYQHQREFKTSIHSNGQFFDYLGMNQAWTGLKTGLAGQHQMENASLALAAFELLMEDSAFKSSKPLSLEKIRESIYTTQWPGRLEYIKESPMVILDGAHNLEAAARLGTYLKDNLSDKKITLVIGILNDKPYKEMLKSLVPHADTVIVTKAEIDRSLDPDILKNTVETLSDKKPIVIEKVAEAVETAVKNASDLDAVCIAGSLYVAGEARKKLLTL